MIQLTKSSMEKTALIGIKMPTNQFSPTQNQTFNGATANWSSMEGKKHKTPTNKSKY